MSKPPRKPASRAKSTARRSTRTSSTATIRARDRSRGSRWLLRLGWLLPLFALGVGGAVLFLTYAFANIPLPREVPLPSAAEVYDSNGDLIGVFSGEERRFLINTEKLIKNKDTAFIGEAVIAAEDRTFYSHNGISVRGMMRAAWADVTSGEIQQGGSTITQQYVKQAVLQDPGRTVERKLKEAILAIKLERRYSKDQILGFYLNTVYFGRGAYGIEAAARTYFAKSATDLNVGEMAFLAGIIPSPESYQPDENPQGALEKRDRVLDLMVEQGFIGQARADKWLGKKVKVIKGGDGTTGNTQPAAYFMEWLRRELQNEYGTDLYTGGFKIHTTLDLEMQEAAESTVAETLTEKQDPQAALISMTPAGEVKAFVGGKAFNNVKKARGFNYVSDNYRQPGSAYKPFTLLAGIEDGVSLQSSFSGSSPYTITDPQCATNGSLWEPENYGGASYGYMDLISATANSVNTIYAQLIVEVGPQNVADLLEDFGFDGDPTEPGRTPVTPNCSLVLGTQIVTPLQMARAYAGMANGGALPEVTPVAYIEDAKGNCVKVYRPNDSRSCGKRDPKPKTTQIVEENSVNLLNEALQSVVTSGSGSSANIGRPVAGKTGTTQNNVDAWFAGYTPQLATVVWVGYPKDGAIVPQMRYCADPNLCRPVHGYEVTGGGSPVSPAPMWANFMAQAMLIGDYEIEYFEDGIESGTVISAPPPKPTKKPKPTETPDPSPSEEPSPKPTEPEPTPTESPPASPDPSVSPPGDTNNRRRRTGSAGPQSRRGRRTKPGGGEP
ncbi:MAG: transglycosylase domain-containing protein [Actinomycetota bacterium]|nr:transglycosylase domain-containing protein [Actinomycetota bacterium]